MSKFVMLTQVREESGKAVFTQLEEGAVRRSTPSKYSLVPVLVSIDHITMLKENEHMVGELAKDRLPSGLDENQSFTKIYLSTGGTHNNSCLTVVGYLEVVASKINDAINAG